jgi:hypothetical protein
MTYCRSSGRTSLITWDATQQQQQTKKYQQEMVMIVHDDM